MTEKEDYDLSESEKIKLKEQIHKALSNTYLYYDRNDVPEQVHTLISYYKSLYGENPRERINDSESWEQYIRYLNKMVYTILKEKLEQDI